MTPQDLIKNVELPKTIDFAELAELASSIVAELAAPLIGRMYNRYVISSHPLVDENGHPFARDQFDARFYPVSKEKWLANLPDQVACEMRLAILAPKETDKIRFA